jgi:hypothetical protein
MPARKIRARPPQPVRAKIEAGRLIGRLQNYVLGKVELSTSQVSAAKILLDKALSNAPVNADAAPGGDLSAALRCVFEAAKNSNGVDGILGSRRGA